MNSEYVQRTRNLVDQIFAKYDRDKNGQLDLGQLQKYAQEYLKRQNQDQSLDIAMTILNHSDWNRNGMVDRNQLFNMMVQSQMNMKK